MLRVLSVCALLIAGSWPAAAYTVKGSVKCPEVVTEDANESYRLANKFWVLGYISARNFVNDSDVAKDVDDDVLYNEVLVFCRNNPTKDMDDAAIELYERHEGAR